MDPQNANEVIVVDVRMKFWSMVVFMVKWVIASIPALMILLFLGILFMAIFQGLFGMGGMWEWRGRMH